MSWIFFLLIEIIHKFSPSSADLSCSTVQAATGSIYDIHVIFAFPALHEPRLIAKFYVIDVNTLIGPCNPLSA